MYEQIYSIQFSITVSYNVAAHERSLRVVGVLNESETTSLRWISRLSHDVYISPVEEYILIGQCHRNKVCKSMSLLACEVVPITTF